MFGYVRVNVGLEVQDVREVFEIKTASAPYGPGFKLRGRYNMRRRWATTRRKDGQHKFHPADTK